MTGYSGPERREDDYRTRERADAAHDMAARALGRIEAHERECVMYREQAESALKRIEHALDELANIQRRAPWYVITVLLGVCGFLFVTLKSQGW